MKRGHAGGMKLFIPFDERLLDHMSETDRLVPYQVGYLVLGQLEGGEEVWAFRAPGREDEARPRAPGPTHPPGPR